MFCYCTSQFKCKTQVISDDKKVEISVNGRENEYLISVDSSIYSVPIDLTIIVQKLRFLKMVEFNEDSYLKVLREKLLWEKDKRTKQ